MEGMTIGTLAKTAGVHVETIRFYQKQGLVPEPRRPESGARRYGPDALARLRFISRAQDIGFTLAEIRELLRLERGGRGAHTLAVKKLATVDRRIADLSRVQKILHDLIARCEAGTSRGCAIIEALSHDSAAHEPVR